MCETETPYIWRLQACITIVSVAQKVSLHRSTVGPGQLAGGWVSGSEKRLRLRVNVLSPTHPGKSGPGLTAHASAAVTFQAP